MLDVSIRAVQLLHGPDGGSMMIAMAYGPGDDLSEWERKLLGPDASERPEFPLFIAHWFGTDKDDLTIICAPWEREFMPPRWRVGAR